MVAARKRASIDMQNSRPANCSLKGGPLYEKLAEKPYSYIIEADMANTSSTPHLHALEQAIHSSGLDLYLVPMVDEFQGEYIPDYAARLPYVTGFTGSAGLG